VRYWEDIKAGEVIELGRRAVTKEAILTFAREFDPQPFHADEAAAQRTIWGGLIASGWHTGSMLMRLFYDGFLKDTVSLGSPGIDELKWLKPVRPGDTLSTEWTVTEKLDKPKHRGGICVLTGVSQNQRGEIVVEAEGKILVSARASR